MRSHSGKPRLLYPLLACTGVLVLAIGMGGCLKPPDDWAGKGGPPRVLVSFPPVYSFVKSVGGDQVGVISLCTTSGPHHFEGEAQDHRLLARADLLFANGLMLDDKFIDPLAQGRADTPNFLVKLGDGLPHDLLDKFEDENRTDPHVWLGIPQAEKMVNEIRDNLSRVDTAHKSEYAANAAKYQEALDRLHKYGEEKLKDKKDKPFISFHDSLHYFAKSYDLKIAAVIEIEPGVAPSPGELEKLVKTIQKENIHVIAVEPQYPTSGPAETLKAELKSKGFPDIELVEIDPLETAEAKDLTADLYERTMRQNIDNLAKHLK
jgi:ABC-type Zn uptake system ZnuABC Zn-binding protein ZnuA